MNTEPKICFIVSSAIEVNNEYPVDLWNDIPRRTDFSWEERYRQTIYTIINLRNISNKAKTFIVDVSLDYDKFYVIESEFENVTYWPVAKYNKNVADYANKSCAKSLCEAMIINEFTKTNHEELLQYDFIVKVSGRYVFEVDCNDFIKNKFMFTKKIPYDPPSAVIHQYDEGWDHFMYPSTIYAFDSCHLKRHERILDDLIVKFMQDENMMQYSHNVEMYLYNGTKDIQENVEMIPMTTYGFAGISKKYIRN